MLNVLLIDDDEDEFVIFSDAIGSMPGPMRYIYSPTLEQAIKILEHLRLDIIFIDMNMPRINGIECIKKINALNNCSAKFIVMYSTHIDSELCEKAKMAGAWDCLKKTNSITALAEKLAPYLLII